ncbi:hypothetical protein DMA11_23320 [Marinilabiliaceae bacterium JC017]|nr:hypothetical protein DMA11_23320 [Marinilabiliaceae bacterium JC017]
MTGIAISSKKNSEHLTWTSQKSKKYQVQSIKMIYCLPKYFANKYTNITRKTLCFFMRILKKSLFEGCCLLLFVLKRQEIVR